MAKKKAKPKENFAPRPSQLARCRMMAGGDVIAGILLYRIMGLWSQYKAKLKRGGEEWIAMSRVNWARSSGLTESELKNRALPRLKKSCGQFLTFKTMRLSPVSPNMLWISVNELAAEDCFEVEYEAKLDGGKSAAHLENDHTLQ